MTNGEWLRRLSDDELAKKIALCDACWYCEQYGGYDKTCEAADSYDCLHNIIAWLRAEHKEDKDD